MLRSLALRVQVPPRAHMKKCIKCNVIKHKVDFNKNKLKEDGLQSYCRLCLQKAQLESTKKHREKYNKANRDRKDKTRKLINSIREEQGCKKCGEKRYWILDFHHVDPLIKDGTISELIPTSSLEKILKEIEKCVVLCKNCHSDFHFQERLNKITLEQFLS